MTVTVFRHETMVGPHRRGLVPDKEIVRLRCYAALAACDLAVMALAFAVANAVMGVSPLSDQGRTMLLVMVPLHLGAGAFTRAYSTHALASARRSIRAAVQALAIAAAAVLFIAYFLKASGDFSRGIFAGGIVGSVLLMTVARLRVHRHLLRVLGGDPHTTVVVRDGMPFQGVGHELVFSVEELLFDPETADPHRYHLFAATVAHADRLIVACEPARYVLWSRILKSLTVDGEIFTDADDEIGVISMSRHGSRRTMVVTTGPLSLRDRMLKRLFDILFAAVALIALTPVFAVVAIAIRLESAGPVFFRQDRIGRDNKIFRMFKFRSMYVDQCDAQAVALTTRNDSRVTRVGEFIRRTSVDELPQLLNVLTGEMSVVGPRPHPLSAKAADTLYWDVDARYRHRHSIKPGLTGLAQIRGFRGNTERLEDLTNRLHADLEYAADWSLSLDLQIIFRTFFVLHHQNAY